MKTRLFFTLSFYLCAVTSFGMEHQRTDNDYDYESIHDAICKADYQTVMYLLSLNKELINFPHPKRLFNTPLHTATRKGHTTIVAALLERGANPNYQNSLGQTALHIAAGHGYCDIVQLLIHAGARTNILNQRNNTPFMHAAFHGKLEILEFLLKRTDSVHNLIDFDELTKALREATVGDQPAAVAFILRILDISVEDVNQNGQTLLHTAAFFGAYKVAHKLIELGADVNSQNHLQQTPLHSVVNAGHKYGINHRKVALCLLQEGASLDSEDRWHGTPITHAASHGNSDILALFTQELCYRANQLPIDSATHKNALIKSFAHCEKALRVAVASDQPEAVHFILQNSKIDIQQIDEGGNTFLHNAARHDSQKVMQLLLELGADVHAKNHNSKKPHQVIRADEYLAKNRSDPKEKVLPNRISIQDSIQLLDQEPKKSPLREEKISKSRRRKNRKLRSNRATKEE